MRWTWNEIKGAINQRKHGVSFGVATQALADPLAMTAVDPHRGEQRYRTLGLVEGVLLLVVHADTDHIEGEEREGRIISARKATPRERRAYEKGE